MSKKHQGKFHLLILFGLPTLLVLLFVVQNWWVSGGFILALGVVSYFLFKK